MLKVKPFIKTISDFGMPAVAVTDLCNLFALVKFYKGAVAAGIKPIAGADLLLENPDGESKPTLCTLLVQNREGYANLTKLISMAYLKGQKQGLALIKYEWLSEHSEGLIALSGAREGDVGHALLSNNQKQARECIDFWRRVFPDRYYLEIQRTGREGEQQYLQGALLLAEQFELPVVATNDVRFIHSDDFEAHEARVCIHDSRTLDDPRRARLYSEHQYLKSSEEMVELFSDLPEAIENTLEIAMRCNLEIELGKNYLPNYPVPEGMTMDDFFRQLSLEGLEKRFEKILNRSADEYPQQRQTYIDRLNFELNVIIQMGFPGYFLIVMDFIKWAKDNQVPVGPGRGSGAGSLVAYALDITDLDPLEFDLLFERFLNPERVSMPDFDVDFCMDGRDRVIDYVAQTYGREAVSQIITFGTMAAKAVVRDVARVQGKPYGLADKLSKMIPFEVGMTLSKAMEQEPTLADFVKQSEEAAEIMEMAFKLEGVTRNVGKHAGGVVISPTKLTDFSPLYCDEAGGSLVTQYDKDDVEQVGLVKFDFLGLRTLTIIDWAVESVNKLRREQAEQDLDISQIDLEDKQVYKLLKNANTTAVFQLESRGMKDLMRRLEPNTFEDIIALVALFRPGPLQSGMVDDFIARKKGKAELAYPHPQYQHECLKPVLEPSYGIILYQEQVMQIAQVMGGYTLGGADLLRRAMGKKKAEEMAKQRQIFMEGASQQGFDEDLARNIFDLMEKFAGYGFNKSHSAAYALLSYQTAWLKTYYPAPFMAAVLSADMQNTDKVVILLEDCRQMELPLVLPNINIGEYRFTVDGHNQVVYGLGAIKGLGEGPIESIVEARRKGGDFNDLFDFCARVDLRKVNRRAIEALIRSGAMDEIAPHRAVLVACLEEAIKTAEQHSNNEKSGMVDLFGGLPGAVAEQAGDVYEEYQQVRPWTEKVRLQAEKETLGLYLRGHPFDEYEAELRTIAKEPLVSLQTKKSDQIIAGLVVAIRTMKSKRGDSIAFVTLDDRTGRVEVSVFAEAYETFKDFLMKDNLLVIEGEVSHDDYSGAVKVRAKAIYDVVGARARYARHIALSITKNLSGDKLPHYLADILSPFRGAGCKMLLEYSNEQAKGEIQLGNEWTIKPDDELLTRLKDRFGDDKVSLCY